MDAPQDAEAPAVQEDAPVEPAPPAESAPAPESVPEPEPQPAEPAPAEPEAPSQDIAEVQQAPVAAPAPEVASPAAEERNTSPRGMGVSQTRSRSPGKKGLTFSGAPHADRARPYQRSDYSHSEVDLARISAANEKLCKSLMDISAKPSYFVKMSQSSLSAAASAKAKPCHTAPTAINRRKKDDMIAQQNLAIYKRLQAIKPTMPKADLDKSWEQAQTYGANCSRKKAPI